MVSRQRSRRPVMGSRRLEGKEDSCGASGEGLPDATSRPVDYLQYVKV